MPTPLVNLLATRNAFRRKCTRPGTRRCSPTVCQATALRECQASRSCMAQSRAVYQVTVSGECQASLYSVQRNSCPTIPVENSPSARQPSRSPSPRPGSKHRLFGPDSAGQRCQPPVAAKTRLHTDFHSGDARTPSRTGLGAPLRPFPETDATEQSTTSSPPAWDRRSKEPSEASSNHRRRTTFQSSCRCSCCRGRLPKPTKRRPPSSPPSNQEPSTNRLHLRPQKSTGCHPADNAGALKLFLGPYYVSFR